MILRKHVAVFGQDEPENDDDKNNYKGKVNTEPVDDQEGTLVTSLMVNMEGYHAPVIDFDVPSQLWPPVELLHSSQIKHHHLYINKPVVEAKYWQMLEAMAQAGVVEQGYYEASVARGYSAVRTVGTIKPGVDPSIARVLAENSALRQEVIRLRYELQMATGKPQINIMKKVKAKLPEAKEKEFF